MTGRIPNRTCDVCGVGFYKRPLRIENDKSHCCSHECQNKLRTERVKGAGNHQYGLKGSLNDSHKSDWRVSPYGYILVRCLTHPFRMHDGYVFAHRLVLEEYLRENSPGSEKLITVDGQLVLSPEVVVHHVDGNRANNSLSNLEAMYLGDHLRHHNESAVIERNPDGTFRTVGFKSNDSKRLSRKHILDAGQDIYSAERKRIYPGKCEKISTGLKIEVPPGYVGLLWSRSGLSAQHGIEVGAGCIDSGYTGEVGVVLYNHSEIAYMVNIGDKIAQLLTIPISLKNYETSDMSLETERGTGGFGSTGV